MNPVNSDEVFLEVCKCIEEGVFSYGKPAIPYLDIVRRVKPEFQVAIFVYQANGEYNMIKMDIKAGVLSEAVILESIIGIKHVGADAILIRIAKDAVRMLLS